MRVFGDQPAPPLLPPSFRLAGDGTGVLSYLCIICRGGPIASALPCGISTQFCLCLCVYLGTNRLPLYSRPRFASRATVPVCCHTCALSVGAVPLRPRCPAALVHSSACVYACILGPTGSPFTPALVSPRGRRYRCAVILVHYL